MAYNINQITSASSASGIIDITAAGGQQVTIGQDTQVPSGIYNEEGDQAISLNFTESYIAYSFTVNHIYYLTADLSYSVLEGLTNIQNQILNRVVSLKLRDDYLPSTTQEQFIDDIAMSFSISSSQLTIDQTYHVEIIFKPIQNFSRLYVAINRTLTDLVNIQQKGTSITDDYITIDENHVKLVDLTQAGSVQNINKAIKIGIQGTPGLLMCINGQAIRIGPSGRYEIRSGYKIASLMILKKNSAERFILDYLTESTESSL